MNWVVTAFPFLIYIGTIGTCPSPRKLAGMLLAKIPDTTATGMMYIVGCITVGLYGHPFTTEVFTSYYSLTLALSVILTSMIIIRLALHNRNLRNAIGSQGATGGLYRTIILMPVESFSLYAVA